MRRPRVLLANDHRLSREALAALLQAECDVVGAAADGNELLAVAPALRPDVVVLDTLPLPEGLDVVRQLRRMLPAVKVIFLSPNEDPDLAAELLRAGAAGCLFKNAAASELFRTIRETFEGGLSLSASVSTTAKKAGGLSPRRREVLRLLAEGRSMKEVARILKIAQRTVAFHKYGMMEELGIRTNAELIQYAIKQQLVTV